MAKTYIKADQLDTVTFEDKVETAVTTGGVTDPTFETINITSVNPADTATLFGTDDSGDSTFHMRIGNGANDIIRIESWDGASSTSLMEIGQDTVVITGNLVVSGTTTTINSETLEVGDNQIILNSGLTGAPGMDALLTVERGPENDVAIRWNETDDAWQLTNDGATYEGIVSPPIGSITGVHPDCNVTPNATNWAYCNGSGGPYHGFTVPDLTDSRFLMGSTAYGVGGSNTMLDHTHTESLTAAGQSHTGNSGSISLTAAGQSGGSHNHQQTGNVGGGSTLQSETSDSRSVSTRYTNSWTDSKSHTHSPSSVTGSVAITHTHAASAVSGTIGTGSAPASTSILPQYFKVRYYIRIS